MVGVPSVWLEYPQFGGGTLRLVWVPFHSGAENFSRQFLGKDLVQSGRDFNCI